MGVFVLSNDWSLDDDDDLDQDQGNSGKPDPVRAQLKKLDKENKELRQKYEAAVKAQRTSTIKDVLTAKKMPAKLANLIPSDVEPTTDAIEKWLADYADLFTKPQDQGNDDSDASGDVDAQAQADVEMVNAFARMAQASAGATPPGKPGDLLKKIMSPDLKEEELLGMITAAGGGFGTG